MVAYNLKVSLQMLPRRTSMSVKNRGADIPDGTFTSKVYNDPDGRSRGSPSRYSAVRTAGHGSSREMCTGGDADTDSKPMGVYQLQCFPRFL